mmetsp:Transcript_26119/g.59098  ORF Transcript_26119/g.59098 Transcript_26119/m.59098 type:complete len:273 (-) Transcript_26119:86-904(-)
MTVALEALAWVDEVLIERTGGGSSPDCGYTYSVYFTGNGLHVQDDSDAAALSLIVPAYDDPVCTPLAYFSDGTKQIFGATEVSIEAARVRPRGFNLPTSNATDAHLMEVMSTLPTFVDVYDVRRSLSDDRLGFKWTVVFGVSMGNAPPWCAAWIAPSLSTASAPTLLSQRATPSAATSSSPPANCCPPTCPPSTRRTNCSCFRASVTSPSRARARTTRADSPGRSRGLLSRETRLHCPLRSRALALTCPSCLLLWWTATTSGVPSSSAMMGM